MEQKENWDDDNQTANNNEETTEEEKAEVNIIPGYSNFDDYLKDAFNSMRASIKAANNLPTSENYRYYSCFPSFKESMNESLKTVLSAMQSIVNIAGVSGNIRSRDMEEKFELVLESNDVFLDRANICMDEESGIARNPEIQLVITQGKRSNVNGSWNTVKSPVTGEKSASSESAQAVRLLAARNVQRPQLMFEDKIDNSSKAWEPRIKYKPNSLKPLAIYVEESESGEVFSHPYEYELMLFEPPDTQLQKTTPATYKPLEETALVMITKPQDIGVLLEDLKNYKEIAVDLEHHSYRSFQGITCLMQISTGDTDYLIDTLSLRSKLHELNEIFTKPSILKVFHGADSDIQWLQRDLSLYIVNMFDTHQAAKQLNLPYLSLAYLLKKYCGIDPNKHFQLADWRIRPLPDELLKYAREDTHYLLHIKDVLRNELLASANGQTNVLRAVYDRSTEICKKTYVKPVWTEDSYMTMYKKSHKMFDNRQLYALKELHKWRGLVAREEDDSLGYVLPNHMLLNIAEALPREMQGILACCNPIPPLVRQNLLKLHKIVLKAREQPLIKPVLEDDLRKRLTQRNQYTNSGIWEHTPHDIPSGTEARADLPCLLDKSYVQEKTKLNATVKHTVTVFDSPSGSEDEADTGAAKLRKFLFVSPFERYKRVMPMVAEQEAQEREKQKKEEEERLGKLQSGQNQTPEDPNSKETAESISRVYEHFQKVTADTKSPKPKKQKQDQSVPLAQMPGRKRKRDSSVHKKAEEERSKANLSTPVPTLNAKITQGVKRKSDQFKHEEKELRKSMDKLHNSQQQKGGIPPIVRRAKGEKKQYTKELAEKGMLPSNVYDYKSVDFSSFQGGSLTSTANNAQFQQRKKKNKEKVRNRKKKKLNI